MSTPSSATNSIEKLSIEGKYGQDTTMHFDEAAERRLVRKFDIRIMPIAFLLYLICFIGKAIQRDITNSENSYFESDRANVGNAKIAGLEKDLHLVGYQYNICLTVFYIAYSAVELPSNLIAKRVGLHWWIPCLVIAFGWVSFATAYVKNFAGLCTARVVLGIAEGGVMPGLTLYLSRFYRRRELVFRIGIFVSSAALSGAFGGLLASGLLSVEKIANVHSWRNIFFIEGLISVALGIIALPLMARDPENAGFLTPEERALASARIRSESAGTVKIVEDTKARLVKQGLFNINNWLCALGFLLASISVQGLSLFAPTILKDLYPGKTTVQVQLRTVPPYVVAWVYSLVAAWLADKFDRRAYIMIVSNIFGVIGYAMFVGLKKAQALYAAMFFVMMAFFTLGPFFIAWAMNNAAPDTMRAVSSALVISVGILGSIAATWSYLPHDAPRFHTGNSVNLGAACISLALCFVLLAYNLWENKQRRLGRRDHRLNGLSQEEEETLGSAHPKYMYSY